LFEIGRQIGTMIDKALPTKKTLKLDDFKEAATALDYLNDLKMIGSK
jgi:hypothetical protein